MKRVVKRTLSAETLALEESLEAGFLTKSLLVELIVKGSYKNIILICCYNDNKSRVNTINSNKTLTEKRYLQVDICIIREIIDKREVNQIAWCDSRSQLTGCLTKVGVSRNKLMHIIEGDGKLLQYKLYIVRKLPLCLT